MATLSKGKVFTNGELVTPATLHSLVDSGTVTNIVNADISNTAAIADSKLAQITTAGKVANTATTATSANTANAIVSRDAGGSFTAGTITAALSGNAATATTASACSGNAATATTLQTARTINGVSFNGSGNITVTAAPNAHTHAISDTTGLQTALDGKQASGSYAPATGIAQSAVTNLTTDLAGKAASSHTHDASAITSGTLSNARTTATSANTANAIVARDASGDFLAGKINGLTVGKGGGSESTNTAVGHNSLQSNTSGYNNTAVGLNSLLANTTGNNNTAVGLISLNANTTGTYNVGIGVNALLVNTTGSLNTAIGAQALETGNFSNCSGVGHYAQVTGSNQVQLGKSTATTYAYGAVQDRSDVRDKADIRDTTLGLEFVNALRPVDFKWDMREDYRPEAPQAPDQDASQEAKVAYQTAKAKWMEDVKLANITHDGSKKRGRYHHGLIAQEVKAVLDSKGIDFGGYQDHSIKGGDDVLSIGYEELIAPMLKAIQELSAEIAALKSGK